MFTHEEIKDRLWKQINDPFGPFSDMQDMRVPRCDAIDGTYAWFDGVGTFDVDHMTELILDWIKEAQTS